MSRRALAALVAAAVVIAVAVGAWWYIDTPRRNAARAVRAYDVALSRAVRDLDPELLGDTASDAEKQRVASYVTLLWGRGVALDATLKSMEVESVRSAETTLTATVTEVWSYQDVDSRSGKPIGESRQETMRLIYTIVPRGGTWIVERSSIDESGSRNGTP